MAPNHIKRRAFFTIFARFFHFFGVFCLIRILGQRRKQGQEGEREVNRAEQSEIYDVYSGLSGPAGGHRDVYNPNLGSRLNESNSRLSQHDGDYGEGLEQSYVGFGHGRHPTPDRSALRARYGGDPQRPQVNSYLENGSLLANPGYRRYSQHHENGSEHRKPTTNQSLYNADLELYKSLDNLRKTLRKPRNRSRAPQTRPKNSELDQNRPQKNSTENQNLAKGAQPVAVMNSLNPQSRKVDEYLDTYRPKNPKPITNAPIEGPLLFPNGATYLGQLDPKGHRNGSGTQIWQDGSIYTGEWQNGLRHGEGRQIYEGGDFYEGEWEQDRANGNGFYFHVDGTTYEGQLRDDMQHGKGVEVWGNGSVYTGQFWYGLKEGKGSFSWVDGSEYVGDFKGNEIEGYGKFASEMLNEIKSSCFSLDFSNFSKFVIFCLFLCERSVLLA